MFGMQTHATKWISLILFGVFIWYLFGKKLTAIKDAIT